MKYTTFNVQQLANRKGKQEPSIKMCMVSGKKQVRCYQNDNTDYFKLEEEQEDTEEE